MNKIRYINLCIVEFAKKFHITPRLAFNYLNEYQALAFLDRCYDAEHELPLEQTLKDMAAYSQRHGGALR